MDHITITTRTAGLDQQQLSPSSIVGSFFHSFNDEGGFVWQGVVVAEPRPGFYLVETFEWLAGGSCAQQLVPFEDMAAWRFYDTSQWMNNEYELRG